MLLRGQINTASPALFLGRSGGDRTRDLIVPNDARYLCATLRYFKVRGRPNVARYQAALILGKLHRLIVPTYATIVIMLTLIACLAGVTALISATEFLQKHSLLKKGELLRKIAHMAVAIFVASWPWLMDWSLIQLGGGLLLGGVLLNRQLGLIESINGVKRRSYGDIFFALAIILSATVTDSKVFFALALLHLALADGLAAITGTAFGAKWRYSIIGQTKTVIGSMVFWVMSLWILGAGLLIMTNGAMSYHQYFWLLVALPPVLTVLENISVLGLDNILVPTAVVTILGMVVVG